MEQCSSKARLTKRLRLTCNYQTFILLIHGMQPDLNAVIFLQALRSVLPFLKQQDDARLTKRIGIEKTKNAADDLAGYIVAGTSEQLNQNEKLALSCQLLKCLVVNIEEREIPITLNTVINNMEMLNHAVNTSFPGYADSHLLRYIITPRKIA
jgi:hypothetical protein